MEQFKYPLHLPYLTPPPEASLKANPQPNLETNCFLCGLFFSLVSRREKGPHPSFPLSHVMGLQSRIYSQPMSEDCLRLALLRSLLLNLHGVGDETGCKSTHETPPLTGHTLFLEDGFKPLPGLLPGGCAAK